ncbi:MAG: hypothetical protein LBD86_07640 [Spirochaetaceae bacterium]|nr:hypothetical protein [Spirochaetaceae bacterium]
MKGETPVVKTSGGEFSINMISAICGTGDEAGAFHGYRKNGTASFCLGFNAPLPFLTGVGKENIADFPGKRFSVLFEGEAVSRYSKRIPGTRIKRQTGEVPVKVYDKFGNILRIEVRGEQCGGRPFLHFWHEAGMPILYIFSLPYLPFNLYNKVKFIKRGCSKTSVLGRQALLVRQALKARFCNGF